MAETARVKMSLAVGKPPLGQPKQAQSTKNIAAPASMKLEVLRHGSKPERQDVEPAIAPGPAAPGEPLKKVKAGQPTQKKLKRTPRVLGKTKKAKEAEEEQVAVEDGPPPQPKVPAAPPRTQCTRCSRSFLTAEMLPYQVRKDGHFYRQILELCKDEPWLKAMLQK